MCKLPKVTFRAMTFKGNMDMIAMFIQNELNREQKSNTTFFKNKYHEIYDIDFSNMNREQISEILQSKLFASWQEEMNQSKELTNDFQKNWNLINDGVMKDLSNLLNMKWPDDALDIQARVGIMYACPRYINQRMFDTNINVDMNKMREIAIHEICHFLYFEKWKKLFNDYDERHYNNPHIIWYLSEAIIDPLLNNDIFKKYTNIEIPSYRIFYDTIINENSVIDNLRRIVTQESIEQAIKDSYTFFIENEQVIKNVKNNTQDKKVV